MQSQFPSAIGLKFRNPVTKAFRAIKLVDGYLFPPNSQNGWGEQMVYIVNTAGAAPVTSNTQGKMTSAAKSIPSSKGVLKHHIFQFLKKIFCTE